MPPFIIPYSGLFSGGGSCNFCGLAAIHKSFLPQNLFEYYKCIKILNFPSKIWMVAIHKEFSAIASLRQIKDFHMLNLKLI